MTEPQPAAKRVGPYTLTAGRTRPGIDLPIEVTVETIAAVDDSWSIDDARTVIVGLCGDRQSIAEISSYANMPIGVVRVLVADLIESGHLRAHATLADRSAGDQRRLIERTLDGLRAL